YIANFYGHPVNQCTADAKIRKLYLLGLYAGQDPTFGRKSRQTERSELMNTAENEQAVNKLVAGIFCYNGGASHCKPQNLQGEILSRTESLCVQLFTGYCRDPHMRQVFIMPSQTP